MNDKKRAAFEAVHIELTKATGQLKAVFRRTDKVLGVVEAMSSDYELCNDKCYQALVAAHFAAERAIEQIGNILNK